MGHGAAGMVLASLVLLAGCSGFFASPSPTQSPDPTTTATTSQPTPTINSNSTKRPDIQVDAKDFPIDPNIVWSRVQSLLETGVEPPERIVVTRPSVSTRTYSRFYSTLTGVKGAEFNRSEGGSVRSPDTVRLYVTENTSEANIEAILVHEYVHVIQFRTNAARNSSFDIRGALYQGGAIYVAEVYAQRYLNDTGVSATAGVRRFQRAAPSERLIFSQNYYGYRYITHRIDSPQHLDEIYSNPPKTTEELIHNLPPGAEPVLQLNLAVQVSAESEWLLVGNTTQGELTVRSVLWTQLNDSTVDFASSGWGNDRLLTFWNGTEYGYVWILRWDDARNATEFQDVMTRFLGERATPTQQGWVSNSITFQVHRVHSDTVVVIAGEKGFVTAVSVTGEERSVSVTID